MVKLSKSLTQDDIEHLKYFYRKCIPSANREKIVKGIDLFMLLEQANLVGPSKMETLRLGLDSINRGDLLEDIDNLVLRLENEFKEVQQKNMKEVFEGWFVLFISQLVKNFLCLRCSIITK